MENEGSRNSWLGNLFFFVAGVVGGLGLGGSIEVLNADTQHLDLRRVYTGLVFLSIVVYAFAKQRVRSAAK